MFERAFSEAAEKQYALENNHIDLFKRDPTIDSKNSLLNYKDNLENVPRTTVSLLDLADQKEDLASTYLNVFESPEKLWAPSFFSWAGERIPAAHADFKGFMAYHYGTKAYKYAAELFTNLDYTGFGLAPLKIYYKRSGNPFGASFEVFGAVENPADPPPVTDIKNGYVQFYESSSSTSNMKGLNFAVSADAVIHEVGHVIQALLNEQVFLANSKQVRALQEGLSDLFAAAVVEDSDILKYLTTSYVHVDALDSSLGPAPSRTLDHSLIATDSYSGNIHMDGRLIAGAFNDFRKYLQGQSVTLLGCSGSSCTRTRSSGALTQAEAFKAVFYLSHKAFQNLGTFNKQSFHAYSAKVIDTCPPIATCSSFVTVLTEILTGRGLYFASADVVGAAPDMDTDSTGNNRESLDLIVEDSLGWIPVNDSTGKRGNSDGSVSPCEVIRIFPNVTNASRALAGADNRRGTYHIRAYLEKLTGATEWNMSINGTVVKVEKVLFDGTSDSHYKSVATLKPVSDGKPQESTSTLFNDASSRIFQPHHGAFFSKLLTIDMILDEADRLASLGSVPNEFVNSGGTWLVKVSDTTNINIRARWTIKVFALNDDMEDDAVEGRSLVDDLEQSITADSNEALCQE